MRQLNFDPLINGARRILELLSERGVRLYLASGTLATLDKPLAEAARKAGVRLLIKA